MRVRRLAVLVVVSALAAMACSASNDGTEPPPQGDAADPSFSELVTGLAELTVDRERYGDILAAGCGAWVPRAFEGDAASFNEWIYELFGSGGSGFSLEEVDAAFTTACAENRDDPMAFVASVLGDLDVSIGEFLGLVDEACAGYRTRRVANAEDPFAPDPIDPIVAGVMAEAGVDPDGLQATVDAFCDVPEPGSIPPLAVLPDLALSPGEVDPEFDVSAACDDPPAVPPIPTDLVDTTIDRYGVEPSAVEVRRLIPFELGGTTAVQNLFPITTADQPGAADKLAIDAALVELVCEGAASAEEARTALVVDWPLAFVTLSPPG